MVLANGRAADANVGRLVERVVKITYKHAEEVNNGNTWSVI